MSDQTILPMAVLPGGRHDPASIKKRIGDRLLVASVSGGKDSAAMCLYLKELGIPYRAVFMDTGWEHDRTYEYLRGDLTRVLGPIEEIRSRKYPGGMPDLVVKRGMFPSRVRRMCTQELKVYPMRDYMRALQDAGEDPVNTVGIRAAESESRSKMPEWEWSDTFDCEVWRPLLKWSEEQVIEMHTRHGLRPNPLYLAGSSRVGCWPCIFARKDEVRMVAETDPERVEAIMRLEAEVAQAAEERYREKGQTFESLGYERPAFFQSRLGRVGTPWPIARAIAWSKTPTRGKEPEPFDDPQRGCMRWGLCETQPPDPDGESC